MSKKTQKGIMNEIKKTHKATIILVLVFIILGVGAGLGTTYYLTKDDVFKINGETEITINLNDVYEENGATAIAFGKDVSDSVEISGEVDTTTEGKYIITYTIKHIRFLNHKLYKLVNVVGEQG